MLRVQWGTPRNIGQMQIQHAGQPKDIGYLLLATHTTMIHPGDPPDLTKPTQPFTLFRLVAAYQPPLAAHVPDVPGLTVLTEPHYPPAPKPRSQIRVTFPAIPQGRWMEPPAGQGPAPYHWDLRWFWGRRIRVESAAPGGTGAQGQYVPPGITIQEFDVPDPATTQRFWTHVHAYEGNIRVRMAFFNEAGVGQWSNLSAAGYVNSGIVDPI